MVQVDLKKGIKLANGKDNLLVFKNMALAEHLSGD